MLIREARVVALDAGLLQVRIERAKACGQCRAAKVCAGGAAEVQMSVPRPLHPVHAGQTVLIALEEGPVLRATATLYLVPLLGFLAGLLLGHGMAMPEIAVIAMAFLGLAAGFWVSRRLARRTGTPPEPYVLNPAFFSEPSCKEPS